MDGPDAPAAGDVRYGLVDVAVVFVATVVIGTVGTVVALGAGAGMDSISFTVAGLLGEWIAIFGGAWLISHRRGTASLVSDFGLRLRGWGDVGLGLAAGLGTSIIFLGVIYPQLLHLVGHLVGHRIHIGGSATKLWTEAQGAGRAVFAAAVIIGAPIFEELFFRGLLLGALRRRMDDAVAIGVCGALFGLAHASGTEAAALPALMVFGVVLSFLAVRTGRLGPGIVAHMAFNALTVIELAATH